jgi:His/Glu/Gln/Arg/opine family amino acid ABC transporter permease subunit
MNWNDFIFIFNGAFLTITYSIISVFLGFIIAIPLVIMKLSHNKAFAFFATFYISLIRGTPLILQLSLWYFALPKFFGINLSAFTSATLAFSINSSAYLAEVLRSGFNSIDKGQKEAAQVLGISKKDTFFDILLPQVMKNISPNIMNEIVTMVKESAIVGMIGVQDLMRRAQLVTAAKYDFFMPLISAAIIYYLLGLAMTSLYNLWSKKYFSRSQS